MNCEFCQSPVHIWFQCPKKPDGWKPARLATKRAIPEVTPDQISLVDRGRGPAKLTAARMDVQEKGLVERQVIGGLNPVSRASLRKLSVTAGTQALPVDTPKRPVGRPKTITDMKAYKAERARKYRAEAKAAKSSLPKPSIQTTTEERNEE